MVKKKLQRKPTDRRGKQPDLDTVKLAVTFFDQQGQNLGLFGHPPQTGVVAEGFQGTAVRLKDFVAGFKSGLLRSASLLDKAHDGLGFLQNQAG